MERNSHYTYTAIFTQEADGRFSVSFPALDGCFTQGDTFDEALAMARDAMSLHLYGMEEDGEPIPRDVPVPSVSAPSAVVMVTAWMTPFRESMRSQSVRKTVSVPAWLNDAAEKRGINFSQALQNALRDILAQDSTK